MKQNQVVEEFLNLRERAGAVGITLKVGALTLGFHFNDVPGTTGVVTFQTIEESANFVYGYELGYKSGLKNN